MTSSGQLRSGKGAHDENFPVASRLIKRRHRPVILAFYEFVRVADDIADHPQLASTEKIARLNRLEASLLGRGDDDPEGLRLRAILEERNLSPRHAQDLLSAFRQDATKHRYASWDELIDYCSRSAMPVGRFVLDVHGEARATWPASDTLCAALQVINHLQDCAKDYRALDRVYIPLDALASSGASVEQLERKEATPALKACLRAMVARTAGRQRHAACTGNLDHSIAGKPTARGSCDQRPVGRARASDQNRSTCDRVEWRYPGHISTAGPHNGADAPISDPMNLQVSKSLTSQSSTANRAGGSSFYLAMRLLSREKREAMFEVYSFCRDVDDIADNDMPRSERLALL